MKAHIGIKLRDGEAMETGRRPTPLRPTALAPTGMGCPARMESYS